MVAILEIKHAD